MEKYVVDILEELEQTNSRLEKEEILRKHIKNKLLKSVFKTATDPYIDFGVKKLRAIRKESDTFPSPGPTSDDFVYVFLELLNDELATRKLTGNAAKEAVARSLDDTVGLDRKWCKRILLKNLRVGVQPTTLEKIWPGLVKRFEVQLAETVDSRFEDGNLILKDVSFPVRVDPKLDGLRLIAIKKNGIATLFTRNGTVLETLPKIKSAIESLDFDNFVLDGEGMGKNWNESASILMAHKTHKDDSTIVYNVFDAMPLDQWETQDCKLLYSERLKFAKMMISDAGPNITMVPHVIANSEKEVQEAYEKWLESGYEGVMLKDLSALYKFKRSKGVMKLKPVQTYEGAVVDCYKGNEGAKREGLFGGFEVLLPNGVITRVGSGFTDVLKAEIQLDPASYMGKIVECECQPPLTDDGRMRFPVFVRFRDQSDVDSKVVEAYENWCAKGRLEHGVII